jgi:N-carbamoylputrescine amidase
MPVAHTPFTVGIIQDAATTDVQVTVEATIPRIREAAARGAQIVCLKELFNAPYFAKSQRHERFDIAEPIPGPTTKTMQQVAKELGIVLIVPIFERQAKGVYRNSAAVVDADGSLLGVYRKMHIPDDPMFNEKFYFTPGDATADDSIDRIGQVAKQASGFHVWHTRFADIGVLICWDQWYPEAARITSLLGAEVLFYPTAIGWHPREKAEFGTAQVDA